MEAAIWNANKAAELIAADKLGQAITLNREFKVNEPLMKLMKPSVLAGAALALAGMARIRSKRRKGRQAGQE
jgi:hypothetical protein